MDHVGEVEIINLLKDLQQRMTYLEKKIDILNNKSSERSSGRSYSPSSRYGGPQRYGDKRESRFGARDSRESRFGAKNVREGRFGAKDTREGRFGAKDTREGRPFEKERSNDGKGFLRKKKAFKAGGKKYLDKPSVPPPR